MDAPAAVVARCVVDICTTDWSQIQSASSYSAVSGVAGGFVFAGIIVLLTERKNAGRHRYITLSLFCSSFLMLAINAYMFAVIAGEQVCLRAEAEGVVAGGMLGTATAAVFCGIAWLLHTYSTDDDETATRLCNFLTRCVVVLVGLMLSVAGYSYYIDVYRRQAIWLAAYAVVVVAVVLALLRWPLRLGDGALNLWLKVLARSLIIYTVLCGVVFGVIESQEGVGSQTPPWMVWVAMLMNFLPPLMAMVLVLIMLPEPGARDRGEDSAAPVLGGAHATP
jgi:cytochrome bd-type quinol oxidase subunit 2